MIKVTKETQSFILKSILKTSWLGYTLEVIDAVAQAVKDGGYYYFLSENGTHHLWRVDEWIESGKVMEGLDFCF